MSWIIVGLLGFAALMLIFSLFKKLVKLAFTALALILVAAGIWYVWQQDPPEVPESVRQAGEQAAERLRDAAGEVMEKAGEKVKEGAEKAMEKAGEAVKDGAGQAMDKAVEALQQGTEPAGEATDGTQNAGDKSPETPAKPADGSSG